MTYKKADILLLFVKKESYTLYREEVMDICSSTSNMTSSINRLRTILKESTCRYTISNRKATTGDYRLELRKKNLKQDIVKLKDKKRERLKEKAARFIARLT